MPDVADASEINLLLVPDTQIFPYPARLIEPHPLNRQIYGDEPLREDMLDSLAHEGLREPLVLRSNRMLISGHRRYKHMVALGWETIPKVRVDHSVKDDSGAELALLQFNMGREKTEYQKALEINKWIDLMTGFRALLRNEKGQHMQENITAARMAQVASMSAEQKQELQEILDNCTHRHGGDITGLTTVEVIACLYGKSGNTIAQRRKVLNCITDLEGRGFSEDADRLRHAMNTNFAEAQRQVSKARQKVPNLRQPTIKPAASASVQGKILDEARKLIRDIRYGLKGHALSLAEELLVKIRELQRFIPPPEDQ